MDKDSFQQREELVAPRSIPRAFQIGRMSTPSLPNDVGSRMWYVPWRWLNEIQPGLTMRPDSSVSSDCARDGAFTLARSSEHELPDELWCLIFVAAWWAFPTAALHISHVCSRWRRVAVQTPVLWSSLRLVSRVQVPSRMPIARRQLINEVSRWISEDYDKGPAPISLSSLSAFETLIGRTKRGEAELNLHISVLYASVGFITRVRRLLETYASRCHKLSILYDGPLDLLNLGLHLHGALASALSRLQTLSLTDRGGEHVGVLVADLHRLLAGFARNLVVCKTPSTHSWSVASPLQYPGIRQLDLHIRNTSELCAALAACPQVDTIYIRLTAPFDYSSPRPHITPDQRNRLQSVRISGPFVNKRCDPLLRDLVLSMPRRFFNLNCGRFWTGTAALFETFGEITEFLHTTNDADRSHTVRATNVRGEVRVITTPEPRLYRDWEAWVTFYSCLLATETLIGPFDGKTVSIPKCVKQYLLDLGLHM
ncbi:hypothetical protein EXIGLDRAFT_765239 [Exidia glandulosa HHB12029]|uniref:Uncharacterized protein n=1 Tax=Exidia glandulosa HHB12029 TaxID=1314781 RepID=A0A165KMI7_EXIGL|nr:hypothetical protein EXIGLDRAFT_765239 [Exidia glandulosa HHB12029]